MCAGSARHGFGLLVTLLAVKGVAVVVARGDEDEEDVGRTVPYDVAAEAARVDGLTLAEIAATPIVVRGLKKVRLSRMVVQ